MPEEPQLLPRDLGEAIAAMVRQRWPRDAAKQVAKAWGVDPKTAENVTRGHVSERTLTKAIRAEGWGIAAPLIEAMTGQTYEQHLQTMIEETERARQQVERRRAQIAELERRAAAVGDLGCWPRP